MPFKISILINPIEFKYPLFDCLRNMDGNKKITVSTSGIANKIQEAAEEIGTYLALSLHAPNDELREKIKTIQTQQEIL